MQDNFSVLMSIYEKEKRENFRIAIESVYDNQTLKPNEIVLVEDGILTKELYDEIEKQKEKLGSILKIIKLEKNRGLGEALNIGLKNCTNELIARMDTDDIALPNRFEKQIFYMKKQPEVDILSSFMYEFKDNIENIVSIKEVPINNIEKYLKKRNPINHPSVIFKKLKVLEAGSYKDLFFNEDYYLWARMMVKGAKFANIPEPLVYFRVTDDTYKRRGGWKYVKAEWKIQKELRKLKITNGIEFWGNVILKTGVRMMPNFIRKFIYIKLLRKKILQ